MKRYLSFIVALVFLNGWNIYAQEYSNKGTDFWAGYGYHINMSNALQIARPSDYNLQDLIFYFTSDKNATVTVDIPGIPGFTPQVYNVVANQVTVSSPMPKSGSADARLYLPGQSNKGIHITSDVPIVAYAHIFNASVSGATILFPTATLGKEYYSVNFTQVSNYTESNSFFFVVATEDNTSVEITTTGANLNGIQPNTPTIISLNKGDIYNVMGTTNGTAGTDLTGSKIRSISTNNSGGCKKIAVFAGSGKISIGGLTPGSADNLFAQSLPAVAWGKKYLTAPTGNKVMGQPNNYYRICVKDPNTVVKLNGLVLPKSSLINGFYYQFLNSNQIGLNSPQPNLIESDLPVMVAQYCTTQGEDGNSSPNGDPEMIYLSPVEQTINSITVYSATQYKILQSYLNIIIKNQGVSSFKLDGVSQQSMFQPHPNELNYSYAIIPVNSGSHTLYSDSGFNAIAYGFGANESYGYNAGTNIRDFSRVVTFQNPFKRIDSAVTCVNTDFQFSIPLNFLPQSLRWEFTSAPNILPNTTVIANNSPLTYDSLVNVNNQNLYYFSPQRTFKFSKTNNSIARDTIKLYTTTTTPDGCGSTEQIFPIPVKVLDLPIANFITNNSGCIIDSVHFLDATNTNGQATIENAIWDFGDNTFDTLLNPVKKYSLSNTYTIRYRPITNYGCIGDTSIKKSFTDFPTALFNVKDGCKNQSVTITDQSTAVSGSSIVKWYWDYGNGKKDTLNSNQARNITYTDTGSVTIQLIVESNSGCMSKQFSKTIQIKPIPEPGFILPEVCQNDAVTQFFDTTKISDNSNNFTYQWNFNASIPNILPNPIPITQADTSAKNPKVKYFKAANYIVTEKVISNNGCSVILSQPFTVNGSNPNPDFEILNNSSVHCSNQIISIKNKSSMLDFGNVTRLDIYWDTNDLTKKTSIEQPVYDSIYTYTYPNFQTPSSKNYTIRLVAFSGDANSSCNKMIEKSFTLFQSPKLNFNPIPPICSDASPTLIKEASFDTNVANAIGSPFYSGKGIVNSITGLFDPRITGPGQYKINYTAISDKGCTDSLSQSILVYQTPIIELGPNLVVLENGQVVLTPQNVQGNALQYLWSPPTYLNSINVADPISTPKNDISYTLEVTGEGNCSAIDSISIKVLLSPKIPNAFSPNGDGINDTWKIQYLESYPGATVDVFNRYGQKVFSSLGYQKEWDGKFNGLTLPVGVYYFIINPKNGRPIFSGSVTIIK